MSFNYHATEPAVISRKIPQLLADLRIKNVFVLYGHEAAKNWFVSVEGDEIHLVPNIRVTEREGLAHVISVLQWDRLYKYVDAPITLVDENGKHTTIYNTPVMRLHAGI